MTYAKTTTVSPEKTLAEIQSTLKRYGAGKFGFMSDDDKVMVAFEARERRIRFVAVMPKRGSFKLAPRSRSNDSAQKAYEQAVRARWRALLLTIKAKLESVESGIETFEEAFMAQLVLPNGQTMAEYALPQIESAYSSGNMPPLLGSGAD